MAASGTGKSAGQRALTQRRRNRTLPAIEVPRVEDQDLTRALGNIAEHLRIYEGDVAAPKERFITLQELEDTGLIESQTKGGYAYISRILSKDVAQKSGSTANPTLKGTVRKDTALGPRTAGGGGGGSQNPIEQGKRGLIQKLSDIENVVVQSPAQADFLYYDGGKWKNFSLFKRNNKWTGRNTFVNTTTFSGTVSFSSVTAVDYIDFTPQTTAPAHEEGRLFYDAGTFAMSYYNEEADVTVNIGQETMLRVRNNTGVDIANGAAVYINGSQGANLPTIALAQADALATSRCIGLATHDIENNSNGYVTTLGEVRDLDTSSFSGGDVLFLSTSVAGELQNTRPTTGWAVVVGVCTVSDVAVGEIKVVNATAQRSDLTSASQDETVSGAWTFSNSIDFTKAAVAGAYGSTVNLYSGNPQVSIHDTGAAADEGVWNIIGGADTLKFRVLSDDFATAVDVMTFNRGTGATIADVTFDVEVTGADSANVGTFNAAHASGGTLLKSGNYVAMGNHYSSQRTWLGNNVYVDPADAVSSQARYAVSHSTYGHTMLEMAAGQFWFYGDSANVTAGDIVTKQLLGYMYESGGVANLELGIESTTIGGQLRLHGTTANKTSELTCTNGNLHIDSAAGSQVYLNYYSNTGGIYIGAAGGFKATMTGQYGAVQTQGSTGGYGGISLDGNFALMNSGSAHVGLYNDVNNEWMFIAYPNSYIQLYYNGVAEFRTQDSNAAGNTTGAQVKLHADQALYDVGLNVMPRVHSNTSFTLTDDDCGGYFYHSNSTVYTITLNNSGGGGADFPIGGTFFVLNYGTGNVTVNTGSGTLYSPQLGTSTTGSRTIGGNSVATILKYGADAWFIWGDAIS
jgi:hypothetical protein